MVTVGAYLGSGDGGGGLEVGFATLIQSLRVRKRLQLKWIGSDV